VAWAGAAAVVGSRGRPEAENRFESVRRGALDLVGGSMTEWRERAPRDRPRFFGGFAFLDEEPADPVWRGFPRAAFLLPRFALERRPEGLFLSAHGFGGPDAVGEAELDGVAEALGRLPDDGSGKTSAVLDGNEGPGDRSRWSRAVAEILSAVREGRVEKTVLSRVLDVEAPSPEDTVRALAFLRSENPRAHAFMLEPEPDRVFLGAAPEILAEYRDGRFEATAVAGSIARGGTPEEDRALAADLLASRKDRTEHRLTVDEIFEVLSGRLSALDVDPRPRVLTLAGIQHLETRIRGRGSPDEDVLSLVEALHPTPAVCGRPRDRALELIRESEPFDRGWYAGPVGWFDPAGDGDFVPALRSAVGHGERWRLFAGAGIVEGSDPDAEWAETALKFEPALRALRAGAG